MSSAAAPSRPHRPLFAIGLRLVAVICLAVMFVTGRVADAHGVHLVETLFYRQALALPVVFAWLATQGRTPDSFDAVERLCYMGARGMGALEFTPAAGPRTRKSERIHIESLVQLASEVLSNRNTLQVSFADPDKAAALHEILQVGTSAGGARAKAVMSELYRPLNLNESPLLFVGRRTSELIKYAANAFLAMKITFINEMADLCEAVGADVQQVARGIGLDKRIGSKFLHAGPGYGGSCFPKDTLALVRTAQQYESPVRLIETTVEVNDARKKAMAGRVETTLGAAVAGKTVALLGLTFKPNTDDMRDAPSLDIAQALIAAGAQVQAFDPEGMPEAAKLLPDVKMKANAYDAVEGCDVAVIVTEWDRFRALDLDRIKLLMKQPVLIDLRNIYRPDDMARRGFKYSGIGRG